MLGQSAGVPPSPATSSPSSASTSLPLASLEAPAPPSLAPLPLAPEPAPPTLALPGREARVDEEVAPEVLAVLMPKAEPSSPGEVIELSNDEPKSLTPLIATAALPAAPSSPPPPLSPSHVSSLTSQAPPLLVSLARRTQARMRRSQGGSTLS